jgi:spoIIIJ-associated protein
MRERSGGADRPRLTNVEIQAVTVEDAIRLALEQLELSEDQVDIEILSDAGPEEDAEALVRVTAKGHASQPVPASGGSRGGRPQPQGGRGGGGAPRGDRPPRRPGPRRVPGDRPSSRGVPRPERTVDPNRVDAEAERLVKGVVGDLLTRMGIQADVMAVDNPSVLPMGPEDAPTIFIDVLGNDLGMLIGRRGEHLAQFQYLVNVLCSKQIPSGTRVVIDVEGYRSRREESLIGLADRVARQVARSRRPIVLEPMPPNERRIVHLQLREPPDVYTESSGEGPNRRVEVLPRG